MKQFKFILLMSVAAFLVGLLAAMVFSEPSSHQVGNSMVGDLRGRSNKVGATGRKTREKSPKAIGQVSSGCCEGEPLASAFARGESAFSHHYGNEFSGLMDCCGYDVDKATSNLVDDEFVKMAWINSLKEVDFASRTGRLHTRIELPYNRTVIRRIHSEILSRGFLVLDSSWHWRGENPPHLEVSWSNTCRMRFSFRHLERRVVCLKQ